MPARRALAVVLVVGGAVLSTSSALPARSADRPVGELRDCHTRGEGTKPQQLPPAGSVRIGPLVFWPSIRLTLAGPPNGSEWPYVIKAPVVLPARTKVVLAIAPGAIGRAGFQHSRGYVSAIRFEACREREPAFAYRGTVGKFTGFPFAIGLKQRASCIPMEVWTDGAEVPIRRVVPIGRRSC
jgi:hypothetical protein